MSETQAYLGIWINWSKGPIAGATLTTGHQHGFYLISFLTLFVRMVGAHLWSVIIFIVHQCHSTLEPQDGLYHQHQLLLRNSQSHTSTLWDLTKVAISWRHHTKSSMRRTLPLFLLCLFHLILFTAAAFFSSLIASSSDEVLVFPSKNCGYMTYPLGTTYTTDQNLDAIDYWRQSRSTATWASEYVRDCYQHGMDSSTCNTFARSRIPVDWEQQPCPFKDPSICKDQEEGAIFTDTGLLNSDLHLGINSRPEDSIDYRRQMTCAPLRVDEYFHVATNDSLDEYERGKYEWQFNYGPVTFSDGSSQSYTWSYEYNAGYFEEAAYFLYPIIGTAGGQSGYYPIDGLSDDTADVTLVFMVNWAEYNSPITDPFFVNWYGLGNFTGSSDARLYYDRFPVSVMGCKEWHQMCDHGTGVCSPLTGIDKLGDIKMWQGRQSVIAGHVYEALVNSGLAYEIFNLGSKALQADGALQGPQRLVSAALPADQWIQEIRGWANFTAVRLQRMMYEYAVGPSDPSFNQWIQSPPNRTVFDVCASQKIRDEHYYSFSVLGLVVTLLVGCGIVVLNLGLSSVVGVIQKTTGRGVHLREAWKLDGVLQVQRMAYENAGLGHWSGKDSLVPVTAKGERFGLPQMNVATPLFSPYQPYYDDQAGFGLRLPSGNGFDGTTVLPLIPRDKNGAGGGRGDGFPFNR